MSGPRGCLVWGGVSGPGGTRSGGLGDVPGPGGLV